AATKKTQPQRRRPASMLDILASTKPSMTVLYWKWAWSTRIVAGCIKIATSAIDASQVLMPPSRESLRLKMTAAGTYTKYSETSTVARM
ncbi:MAG: hypothetical protein LQ347_006403, partial [Umbilicaria vellea]